MTMSKLVTKLMAPCLLLFTIHCSLFTVTGQTATATLSGTIQDPNGAVVPGVSVTIQNNATAFERTATTNNDGQFTVPLLPPGTYTVTAKRDGFASVQVRDLVLNVADQKSLAIQLKVGDVNAPTVDVSGEASLINNTGTVANVIDRQFVSNLPLNGRSFQSLILLTPGVVLTQATAPNPGQFSVNGQRSNANYFTVDGVSANSSITFTAGGGRIESTSQQLAGALPSQSALGTTQTLLSVDALEEFKIQTSSYSAEFGRQPGGQVQLTSRAGTNEFHGSLFEFVRNEAFDANSWFTNSRPLTPQQIAQGLTKQPRAALRQNQFGGTFGGPLMLPRLGEGANWYWSGRNRTFFFFSYEGLRVLQPNSSRVFVPSIRLRQEAALSLRPILNAFPIPAEPETIASNGQFSGFAPYTSSFSSPMRLDATSIRIDHAFSPRITMFGRYSETPSESQTRAQARLSGEKDSKRDLTVASTQLISGKLSNETRFNYGKSRGRFSLDVDDFGGAIPIDASILTSGYSGSGTILGSMSLRGTGVSAGTLRLGNQADMRQEQINLVDNLSWATADHHVKFGVDYRRLAPTYAPTEYLQELSFSNLNSIMTGIASFGGITSNQGARPRFNNYSFYVDDKWSVTKRLTINLGLRWEINPPPDDANGRKPTLVCGVENLSTATLCPRDTPIRETDYTAFAPRFGAVYLLNQKTGRETVIRGGFGIFYDLGNNADLVGFDRYPFFASKALAGVAFPLTQQLAQPPTFPSIQLPLDQEVTAVNPELTLPVTFQWNLGLEQSLGAHQVLSVSYVGSAARRLLATTILNNPPLGSSRPNSNFNSIAYTSNGPSSDYHSMQVRYQRRLSRGLQALANYTWSHAIDEISDEFHGTLDKGNADFDVRHLFSGAITYDIPKLTVGPVLDSIFRDWSFDSTLYFQSGPPIDVFRGGDQVVLADGTGVRLRVDALPGVPFWIDDPNAPGGRRINFDAFAEPPMVDTCPPDQCFTSTRQGTLGRNVVREPGRYQVNVSLRRQFSFFERLKLQIKAEAFNVFNRPHFNSYNIQLSSGQDSFGKAENTLNRSVGGLTGLYQMGGPRSLQFSARLSF